MEKVNLKLLEKVKLKLVGKVVAKRVEPHEVQPMQ